MVIDHDLLVGTTEITVAQWVAITGEDPRPGRTRRASGRELGPCAVDPDPHVPMTCIDWWDALRFANAASTAAGLTPAYVFRGEEVRWDRDANGYRLPTEAEWERIAREDGQGGVPGVGPAETACVVANVAGPSTVAAHPGLVRQPFDCEDGFATAAPVGSFRPTRSGLYDLAGNVWEWTWDRFGALPAEDAVDPTGPEIGALRTARGGSWLSDVPYVRVAARIRGTPDTRGDRLGLRLVRTASGHGQLDGSIGDRDAALHGAPSAGGVGADAGHGERPISGSDRPEGGGP